MNNKTKIMIALAMYFMSCMSQLYGQEGIFTVTGDMALASNATYEAHVKDLSGAGTGHDQVVSTGDVSLDGTLDIVLDGYTVVATDQFELMSYGGALTGTFATINWPAAMMSQGWTIDYGVKTPGKVTIYGSSSLLPVELLGFDVTRRDGDHLLRWKTASEVNSSYFTIEHSVAGINYSPIGRIQSKGNRERLVEYSWNHSQPKSGQHYYRLKQVDIDGSYDYSRTISIRIESDRDGITYYPNPV